MRGRMKKGVALLLLAAVLVNTQEFHVQAADLTTSYDGREADDIKDISGENMNSNEIMISQNEMKEEFETGGEHVLHVSAAIDGQQIVEGVDYSWETIDEMEELIISSNKPMVINGYGTTTSENTIVLGNHVSACEINVTLKNVQIDVSEYAGMAAIKILDHYSEKVSLLLSGSNEIKSGDQCAGLMKNNGEQLTITGDGRLTAFGGDDGAGIGGGRDADGKNITIKGGTITATGGKRAIGIGGGFSATTTNIQICDASVKVNAGAFITANGSLSIRQDFLPVNIDSEERVYPVIINHNQETSVTYQKTDVSGATKHILSFPSFHPGDGNFYLYLEAGIYDISVGNREYKGIEVGEEKTVFLYRKGDRQADCFA